VASRVISANKQNNLFSQFFALSICQQAFCCQQAYSINETFGIFNHTKAHPKQQSALLAIR